MTITHEVNLHCSRRDCRALMGSMSFGEVSAAIANVIHEAQGEGWHVRFDKGEFFALCPRCWEFAGRKAPSFAEAAGITDNPL